MPTSPQKQKLTGAHKTSLTAELNGITHIRGYALSELLQHAGFAECVFLLLRGDLPSHNELRIFESILVAAIDHGPQTPSADTARRVASTGNPLNTSVAAGIAALGDYHGGAIEQAGQLFQESSQHGDDTASRADWIVQEGLQRFRRLPGYGHRLYEVDPRVEPLFTFCTQQNIAPIFLTLARATEDTLAHVKQKKLCLNIDGAMAAILCALGFPWQLFRGIFIIARTPGLVAQAWEQTQRESPVLRSPEEYLYDGPPPRKVAADRPVTDME